MYIIGNTESAHRVENLFPEEVATELIRGSAVLDSEYGEHRNHMETGGYALVIDNPADIPTLEHFIHYRTHPCEWATRLGDSGYLSALYIADNDFVIMLYMPIDIAPDEIKNELED